MINVTLALLYYLHFLNRQSQSPKHQKIPFLWHSQAFWTHIPFTLEKSHSQPLLTRNFKGTFSCLVKLAKMSQISFVGIYFPLQWKYHSMTDFFFLSLSLIFHLFQSISYFIAWKIVNNFLFSSPVTPVSEYLHYAYISFTYFLKSS